MHQLSNLVMFISEWVLTHQDKIRVKSDSSDLCWWSGVVANILLNAIFLFESEFDLESVMLGKYGINIIYLLLLMITQ